MTFSASRSLPRSHLVSEAPWLRQDSFFFLGTVCLAHTHGAAHRARSGSRSDRAGGRGKSFGRSAGFLNVISGAEATPFLKLKIRGLWPRCPVRVGSGRVGAGRDGYQLGRTWRGGGGALDRGGRLCLFLGLERSPARGRPSVARFGSKPCLPPSLRMGQKPLFAGHAE